MTASARSDTPHARWLSFFPGAGHLALGEWKRGLHLLALVGAIITIVAWRRDQLAAAFASQAIDQWAAALFLGAAAIGLVAFSVRDVRRMVEAGNDLPLIKSPLQMAWP